MARGPGFATRAVHAGQAPDPTTGAVVPPIHLATTYAQEQVGKHSGFEYSRTDNPTRRRLEECLASLEGAQHCQAFASGMGAAATLMMLFSPGDHVIYMEDVYGGTFRLFDKVLRRYGLTFSPVDATCEPDVEAAFTPATKLVWLETPTNPLLRIVDISAVAKMAHERGALVCVDNTFATPVLQRPLELGADIVLHSATKYLGGHSDLVSGALLTNDGELAERLRFHQNAAGAVPSPFDCWLLLRGLRTLELRVRRQSDSALAVARHLSEHRAVVRVHYPGLPAHPRHELAAAQMHGHYGGVLSMELRGRDAALSALAQLRLFTLAESLGAVESLAELPALMTHASVPPDERARIGLSDSLIRLSIGVEDLDDLVDDLDTALGD